MQVQVQMNQHIIKYFKISKDKIYSLGKIHSNEPERSRNSNNGKQIFASYIKKGRYDGKCINAEKPIDEMIIFFIEKNKIDTYVTIIDIDRKSCIKFQCFNEIPNPHQSQFIVHQMDFINIHHFFLNGTLSEKNSFLRTAIPNYILHNVPQQINRILSRNKELIKNFRKILARKNTKINYYPRSELMILLLLGNKFCRNHIETPICMLYTDIFKLIYRFM